MATLRLRLHRIDLDADSRSTLTAFIKLLTPHIPYCLHILGSILNTVPRSSTLQNVDPSKVTLWSTVPLHHDAMLTIDPLALFSVVIFSQLDYQFRFFCSSDSRPDEPPTEEEEAHVRQVFEHLRDIAHEAHPTYDSILTAIGDQCRQRIDTDPAMIAIWAIHRKWTHILAPDSCFQFQGLRYAYPPGTFERDLPRTAGRWTIVRGSGGGGDDGDSSGGDDDDDLQAEEVEITEMRASDVPFACGASSVPRTEAYILSRALYSVCLRSSRGETPIACVLLHSDGSIGVLRVDPKYRRRGFGRLVVRALVEKLEFGHDSDLNLISDAYRDLGGGALGWNWVDVAADNDASKRLFKSLGGGRENECSVLWNFMFIGPDQS